jgi:large subunit ribosomal protein L3
MQGLLGKKLGMTRIFDDAGNAIAATVIEAGPCVVSQVKTVEKDGYSAIQVGFGDGSEKHTNKPEMGHLKKNGLKPFQVLQEFRGFESEEPPKVGDEIKADIFSAGDIVAVSGISKGKGFQGVVKRHKFHGGPKTHGQSDRWRAPGSVGQSSYPSRVYKGLRMAGRMGGEKVTIKTLRILKVDADNNLLIIRGAIPGPSKSIVLIRK